MNCESFRLTMLKGLENSFFFFLFVPLLFDSFLDCVGTDEYYVMVSVYEDVSVHRVVLYFWIFTFSPNFFQIIYEKNY